MGKMVMAVAERPDDLSRGFQPTVRRRKPWTSRVATIEPRSSAARNGSIVATRLDRILPFHVRGLKPTATIGSRYAANPERFPGAFPWTGLLILKRQNHE
jgi:hypothetical protein